MTFELGRRAFMAGLAAIGIGGAEVEIGALSRDRHALLRAVIDRLAGPVNISDADFSRFADDYMDRKPMPKGMEVGEMRIAETFGATRDLAHVDPAIELKVENFEREAVTEFLLATHAFQQPAGSRLTYAGLFDTGACGNPFARFDGLPVLSAA